MLSRVIFVCVCFVVSTTSAQDTIDEDFLYPAVRCHDIVDRLIQLQADVDQLKDAARSKITNCPTNFTPVPSVNGCYSVVVDNLEWTIAGLRCKSLHPDAHLLVINDAEEQEAIANMMSSYNNVLLAGCARYPGGHSCLEMFWTAGQRVDLARESPFVWKQAPGTGTCCGGSYMSEMRYTNWTQGEPNNAGPYDSNLQIGSTVVPEKCLQLCRGWSYKWNDAVCEIPTCSICEIDV